MLHPLLLSEILGPAIAGFSQFQRELTSPGSGSDV
jgi:hypothetical protein